MQFEVKRKMFLLLKFVNVVLVFCNYFAGVSTTVTFLEKMFLGEEGRAKIARKILLQKNMLMIRSMINILPLAFTCFIICLRNKKMSLWFWKLSHFCVKQLLLVDIQLIQEHKTIVNGLIETTEAIRQDLIQTTSNKDFYNKIF